MRKRWSILIVSMLVASGALAYGYARERSLRRMAVRAVSCLRQTPAASQHLAATTSPTTSPYQQCLRFRHTKDTPKNVGFHDGTDVWQRLRSGDAILLMRHAATEPGTGDPPNFNLADRNTQRNLSDAGRRQAASIGDNIRRERIPIGEVRSSQWFRCRETAELAFGRVDPDSQLNSLYADQKERATQIAKLRELLGTRPQNGNLVLVTHQQNITAVTDLVPEMGEMIVIQPRADGAWSIEGTIALQ